MSKGKRYAAAGIVAAGLIAISVFVINGSSKKAADMVDGKYQLSVTLEEGEDTLLQMLFNAGTMTYEQKMISADTSYTLDTGSYTVTDGDVNTFSEVSDENTLTYLQDGDCILPKNFLYRGGIGKGKTFDASCTYQGKDMTYEISFKADGTYMETDTPAGETAGDSFSGTYVREGNIIRRTEDKGRPVIDLYIYKGQITTSYYEKTE